MNQLCRELLEGGWPEVLEGTSLEGGEWKKTVTEAQKPIFGCSTEMELRSF